jgi:beta-lactamase superfamily II metal-dependent hydrolase
MTQFDGKEQKHGGKESMLMLHVVQAEFGDCLMLEYGILPNQKYILIDGGPAGTYETHLRARLEEIRQAGGRLDLAILSHVDDDHIVGLLDLMAELRQQRANGVNEIVEIDSLWHNAFSQTIDTDNTIETRLKALQANARSFASVMALTSAAVEGIGEGSRLRSAALALHIPINSDPISVDEAERPIRSADGLRLYIVGPTKKNLEELKKEWLAWLDKHEASPLTTEEIAAMADRSVPNLSSIMVLAEDEATGKRLLLTGDGRGDHLIDGLGQANLLSGDGTVHVDVLKVPHHGSARNVTKEFFKTVTADKYVISANGKYGNPDLDTLVWIVEAAREQGRNIEIFVTNETPSTRQLVEKYNPKVYGCSVVQMDRKSDSMPVQIAA